MTAVVGSAGAEPETPERAVLAAGGSLRPAPASLPYRGWLFFEMAAIFGLAPLAMDDFLHGSFVASIIDRFVPSGQVGLFGALMPILVGVTAYLLIDPSFSILKEVTRGFSLLTFLSILACFAIGGGAVAYYMSTYHPALFLEFPLKRPTVYQRIMLLYPLMSVMVQELVFRTFFFHRYGRLFGGAILPAVLINGALFGYAHLVMGNWFAIWSTALIGCLLAYRYATTRSLWAVWFEHSLWGALVFTAGLGRWFFTGIGN